MTLGSWWTDARTRRWMRPCTQVGDSPSLTGRPSIYVEGGQLRIGHRFSLASTPVPSHLDVGVGALLDIGDDVAIGCGAAIAAHEHVRIGHGTHIGPYVIIMDTNFHGSAGDQSLQHDCRPVWIGSGCRIGSRVTIMRGVSIGDGAEILAGSVVTSAIPPGSCAGGGRARIIGRAGEMASRWDSPAAALPEALMTALGLESPPDLDGEAVPGYFREEPQLSLLVQAVQMHCGIVLDRAAVGGVGTYAELAAVVAASAAARSPPP